MDQNIKTPTQKTNTVATQQDTYKEAPTKELHIEQSQKLKHHKEIEKTTETIKEENAKLTYEIVRKAHQEKRGIIVKRDQEIDAIEQKIKAINTDNESNNTYKETEKVEEYERLKKTKDKLIQENINEWLEALKLKNQVEYARKKYHIIRNKRIRKETDKRWRLKASSITEKQHKEIRGSMQTHNFTTIYQERFRINEVYQRAQQLEDRLPIGFLEKQASKQFRLLEKSPQRQAFLHKHTILEGNSKAETNEVLYKYMFMQLLLAYVEDDQEIQALLLEENSGFEVLGSVKKQFQSISQKVKNAVREYTKQKQQSYGRELVDKFNKKINDGSISTSAKNILQKPILPIHIDGISTNNPDVMKVRIGHMIQLLGRNEQIETKTHLLKKQYDGLIQEIAGLFTDKAQHIVNKFSLFGLLAGTQEIMSGQTQGSSLFKNKNLSFSLEQFGADANTIQYFNQPITQTYTPEGMKISNKHFGIYTAPTLPFFTIEKIRGTLMNTHFSLDDLLKEGTTTEDILEKQYHKTLSTYIHTQQQSIENAQQTMHRTIEMQAFIGNIEQMHALSEKNHTSNKDNNQRKQFYQQLYNGDNRGKIDSTALHAANKTLTSPGFARFIKTLDVPMWEFLHDCCLTDDAGTNNLYFKQALRETLDLLINDATPITRNARVEKLTTLIKQSGGENITQKYNLLKVNAKETPLLQ